MAKTLPTQLSICKNLEGLVHQVEGFLSAQQLCLFFPQGYPVKNFPNLFLMDPAAPSHQPSNWGSLLPPLSGWTNKAWRLKAALMSSKVASWDTFKVSSKFFFASRTWKGLCLTHKFQDVNKNIWEHFGVSEKKSLTMLLLSGKTWPNTDLFQKDLGTKCKVLHSR